MAAASNIIQNDVTYSGLISNAAASLYNLVKNGGLGTGVFRTSTANVTIGSGHVNTPFAASTSIVEQSSAKTVTLTETESRNSSYTVPTQAQIQTDINNFMNAIGIPITATIPTNDGLIAFFFALNYFVEKAIIKKTAAAPQGGAVTYHLHYQTPSTSGYTKYTSSYSTGEMINQTKINNIHTQLQQNMLSGGARSTSVASSAHTSSCSSSSCSSSSSSSCSSSCSSSSSSSSSLFIAYFDLG